MKLSKTYLVLGIILFATFIFRFPSLFEPFWYGDEGIFAAVASNLNQGGTLYETGWDNKPPLIYITYALIFKVFGVSMFWLRMVAAIFVLATAAVIWEIAKEVVGTKRALVATFIFGLVSSLRLLEGNLALTEIFMLLPISCAMLLVVKRKFDYISLYAAGLLFGIASLYKQVGALEAAACGIFLFLASSKFREFINKGLFLALGFLIPYALVAIYFAPKGLVGEYIFAAYTYYSIYLEESPQYAIFVTAAKLLPIAAAVGYGLYQKFMLKKKPSFTVLILLWTAFSYLGAYFSGRTYGHYLMQTVPAGSILLSALSLRFKLNRATAAFALLFFIPIIFLNKLLFSNFLSGGPINQYKYWKNFVEFASGAKPIGAYNDFFDSNVNTIMSLADFLALNGGMGESAYIWGDYPWLYAISNLKNPSRYVTSFHVFGVPSGREETIRALRANPPKYILKNQNSIGYFLDLEKLVGGQYTFAAKIDSHGRSQWSSDSRSLEIEGTEVYARLRN